MTTLLRGKCIAKGGVYLNTNKHASGRIPLLLLRIGSLALVAILSAGGAYLLIRLSEPRYGVAYFHLFDPGNRSIAHPAEGLREQFIYKIDRVFVSGEEYRIDVKPRAFTYDGVLGNNIRIARDGTWSRMQYIPSGARPTRILNGHWSVVSDVPGGVLLHAAFILEPQDLLRNGAMPRNGGWLSVTVVVRSGDVDARSIDKETRGEVGGITINSIDNIPPSTETE
jgi:hypothetical protein